MCLASLDAILSLWLVALRHRLFLCPDNQVCHQIQQQEIVLLRVLPSAGIQYISRHLEIRENHFEVACQKLKWYIHWMITVHRQQKLFLKASNSILPQSQWFHLKLCTIQINLPGDLFLFRSPFTQTSAYRMLSGNKYQILHISYWTVCTMSW